MRDALFPKILVFHGLLWFFRDLGKDQPGLGVGPILENPAPLDSEIHDSIAGGYKGKSLLVVPTPILVSVGFRECTVQS